MKLFLSFTILHTLLLSAVLTVLFVVSIGIGEAQVRSSTNYSLESDSINVGGGLSSSTNFTQESTVGEIATGPSDSATYSLRAGYQQMQEIFLSLAGGADITMTPDLPGLTGGESNSSTTFTVITDNAAGYELLISSEGDPAMQQLNGINSIANYNGPTVALFGYTAEGEDIVSVFQDNGSVCNVGVLDTPDSCWRRLRDEDRQIARSNTSNHPLGATTTVKFRVGIGSNASVESGVYVATTTVTALPL